jgi:hypothetical protein
MRYPTSLERLLSQVKYKDESWYIVEGPLGGATENIFKLSKVALPISVREHELSPEDDNN